MRGILNKFVVVYLDDILIYSQNEEEYIKYIQEVLQHLEQHNLFTKLSKYEFHKWDVHFLGLHMGADDISMDSDWVATVWD